MASFYPKTKAEVPFLTELEFCSKVEVTSDYFESNNATKLTTTTVQTKLLSQPKQPPSKQNNKTALQLLLQKYYCYFTIKPISTGKFAFARSR